MREGPYPTFAKSVHIHIWESIRLPWIFAALPLKNYQYYVSKATHACSPLLCHTAILSNFAKLAIEWFWSLQIIPNSANQNGIGRFPDFALFLAEWKVWLARLLHSCTWHGKLSITSRRIFPLSPRPPQTGTIRLACETRLHHVYSYHPFGHNLSIPVFANLDSGEVHRKVWPHEPSTPHNVFSIH